jgi:hypothetical protein
VEPVAVDCISPDDIFNQFSALACKAVLAAESYSLPTMHPIVTVALVIGFVALLILGYLSVAVTDGDGSA